MKKPGQLVVLILFVSFCWQCGTTSKTTKKRNKGLSGTYRISEMTFPEENLTFFINDPQKTFENVVSQIKAEDPDIRLDSSKVLEQVELDLISIGAFSMTFKKDGSYHQSEFFYNNATAPPFSGHFIIDQRSLVLINSESAVYDSYEVVKRSENRMTLRKVSKNNSGVLFIMVMEKVKE